jgi:hypothetical protein
MVASCSKLQWVSAAVRPDDCKSSPYPVRGRLAQACRRTKRYRVTGDGSVAAPGAASAASVAASRYAWGSTPASFADSQSV